jgi:hypothetical protein
MSDIDYAKVPKQALVDALRNNSLGPTNLSRQDKSDLVEIAKSAFRQLSADRAAALRNAIEVETAYRNSK